MVSFSCENCGDVLTKKKLDPHRNQCRGATYTCLDCMVHFYGTDYRAHTSCISEAQKYQGSLYREKDNKKGNRRSINGASGERKSQAMIPRNAYVEDMVEGDETNAIAVIDVPPKAPTPPPAAYSLPEGVNVFDFLVEDKTDDNQRQLQSSRGVGRTPHPTNGNSQKANGDGSLYLQHGYSYGNAPVEPSFERYDSWQDMTQSQNGQAMMPPPPPYVTPGPRHARTDSKEKVKSETSTDKKRKRQYIEELDLSASKRPTSRGDATMTDAPATVVVEPRVLHSGLTGGLSRLVTDPEFYEDRIDAGPTPISPLKRSRHEKDLKDARRKSAYTSYSVAKSTSSKHSESKHHRSRSADRDSKSERSRHHKHHRDESSSADGSRRHGSRKETRAIEYLDRPGSVQPSATNQLISYKSRAELFLSFVTKGPDSEHGCSMNKALKRYHRERDVRGEVKEEDDKELWKSLRLRRNDRGEVVVFF
ncbi:hypothetical protein BAUCODRAFT_39444 [Baudoinia panamericana UAMH 10762]|uniref:Zinc finger C2H2 LYAR-type domain-containing protein n=1 Tax=Baudoinia panamericana (strain UAMH 10762) TaxID=717646 RepID=M2M3X9_BAUPA|nr:uncharacterized protein BAUCODRAFT_39444 [Baudoinia panamericana UAMH 10762]EMC91281.1 hypothetical protein BAUCODRAFT_39444 [Baudoinia panamericana UAMH 10762]